MLVWMEAGEWTSAEALGSTGKREL